MIIKDKNIDKTYGLRLLVITRVLIELKTSGNLKIKEEAVFYYVNKEFRFRILPFNI